MLTVTSAVEPVLDKMLSYRIHPNWCWYILVLFAQTRSVLVPYLQTYGIMWNNHDSVDGDDIELVEIRGNQDLTLQVLLSEDFGISAFSDHLVKEFSTENIQFWKACNHFRGSSSSPSGMKSEAGSIMEEYIYPTAVNQVNIKSNVFKKLVETFDSGIFDKTLFDEAQGEIFNLMSRDSFSRFKRTKACADFITAYNDAVSAKREKRNTAPSSQHTSRKISHQRESVDGPPIPPVSALTKERKLTSSLDSKMICPPPSNSSMHSILSPSASSSATRKGSSVSVLLSNKGEAVVQVENPLSVNAAALNALEKGGVV